MTTPERSKPAPWLEAFTSELIAAMRKAEDEGTSWEQALKQELTYRFSGPFQPGDKLRALHLNAVMSHLNHLTTEVAALKNPGESSEEGIPDPTHANHKEL